VHGGVGVYLGVVQFFFALTWTIYVIFLPALAAQVGIPRSAVIWVLMLDQLIFVLSDYAFGVAGDRAAKVVGRLGRLVVGVTLLSCAAFLALPMVAPSGSTTLFLIVVVLWSITSSALRAPPLTLIGRHAAKPELPWLVALSMLGLGLSNAMAPYLALTLRELDPRVPFLLSSVALGLVTFGLVAAERRLAGAANAKAPPAGEAPAPVSPPAFFVAALLAALAFQVHSAINSAPWYLRHAGADRLPWLSPVFWIGFNLALLVAGPVLKRLGPWRVMAAAAGAAGLASLLASQASGLSVLIGAQLLAGAGWAFLLMGAFSAALSLGHVGREGRFSGGLSSVLALAALARMGVLASGGIQHAGWQAAFAWLPVAGWGLAAAVLFWVSTRRQPPPVP
jgi:hypothetical protein